MVGNSIPPPPAYTSDIYEWFWNTDIDIADITSCFTDINRCHGVSLESYRCHVCMCLSVKIDCLRGVQAKLRPAKVRPSHYCVDGLLRVPLWSHFFHWAWVKVRPIYHQFLKYAKICDILL